MFKVRSIEITLGRTGTSVKGDNFHEEEYKNLKDALVDFQLRKKELGSAYYRIVIIYNRKIIK